MLKEETRDLLDMRRDLDTEMKRISEEFISTHPQETKSCLENIKSLRNKYRNRIEDLVEMFSQVLSGTAELSMFLKKWCSEPRAISRIVKEHAIHARAYALKLAAYPQLSDKLLKAILCGVEDRAVSSDKCFMENILPVPIFYFF